MKSSSGRSSVPRPEADGFGGWQVDVTSKHTGELPRTERHRIVQPATAPDGGTDANVIDYDANAGLAPVVPVTVAPVVPVRARAITVPVAAPRLPRR